MSTPIILTNSLAIIHPAISNPIGQQNNDSTLSLTQHSSPECTTAGAKISFTKSFFAYLLKKFNLFLKVIKPLREYLEEEEKQQSSQNHLTKMSF